MSLTITSEGEDTMNRVASQRLFLTADKSRVVVDGDPEARILLAAGPGDEIPVEYADLDIDAGYLQGDEPDEEPTEDEPAEADDDTDAAPKAAAKPANKAVRKTANKGR